jgi:hypothetical protein
MPPPFVFGTALAIFLGMQLRVAVFLNEIVLSPDEPLSLTALPKDSNFL